MNSCQFVRIREKFAKQPHLSEWNVRFGSKADILRGIDLCPLYPRKQTFSGMVESIGQKACKRLRGLHFETYGGGVSFKVLPAPKLYKGKARHWPFLVRLLLNLLNYQLRSGKLHFLPKKGRVGLTCFTLA